jgi:ribulose-phosphate 3-epimerase
MNPIRLSTSILGLEYNIRQGVKTLRSRKIQEIVSNTDFLHIDIIRPDFIPGKTKFADSLIAKIVKNIPDVKFDFHVMAGDTKKTIDLISDLIPETQKGKTIITIHSESKNPELSLNKINECGFLPGIAFDLDTSIRPLPDYIDNAKLVLLMCVKAGEGGQNYNARATEKIKNLSKTFNGTVSVDGGINPETLPKVLRAGANMLVIGSYITNSLHPKIRIETIRSIARRTP